MKPKFQEQIEDQAMAFKGDFKDVDDEIKVQVRALANNDLTTVRKIQQQEMTKADIQFYLADDSRKKEMFMDTGAASSEYDSDLNKTMF